MSLTAVGNLTLARHHLYYLPRHGINTADCYRYQRDVLGTQLQSQGYVEFYSDAYSPANAPPGLPEAGNAKQC